MAQKSGLIIAAAFIGPGTVTTASLAGGTFGYTILWALLFSVFATFVLQEMASRLGIVTQQGLAEAVKQSFTNPLFRPIALGLIICAIGIGNAAYEAGNLTGAALGLTQVLGGNLELWATLLGVIAGGLLWTGKFKVIERSLISLVLVMSLVFMGTVFIAQPQVSEVLSGITSPSIPLDAVTTIIALIGTTVVPYNLFLHASVVANKSSTEGVDTQIKANRLDAGLSIGFGGLVTLAIFSCAASAFFYSNIEVTAGNIASQLAPTLGESAVLFFAIGLFAAGLTSAITAPLAAAYAVCGAMGWEKGFSGKAFRLVWASVLVSGIVFAGIGVKPLLAILFAQATNGLLLPVIAIFLLVVMNNKALLGEYRNGWLSNTAGAIVVSAVSALGIYKLVSLFL